MDQTVPFIPQAGFDLCGCIYISDVGAMRHRFFTVFCLTFRKVKIRIYFYTPHPVCPVTIPAVSFIVSPLIVSGSVLFFLLLSLSLLSVLSFLL